MQSIIKNTIRDPREVCDEILKKFIAEKAIEWESSAKEILTNNVDTGDLLNSIYTEIDETGFTGGSSAKHAKYFRVWDRATLCSVLFKIGRTCAR